MQFGAFEAILKYNERHVVKRKVLQKLGIVPGQFCTRKLIDLDQLRICEDDKAAEDNSKAGRAKRRLARKKLEDEYADEEGSVHRYGAGLH